MIPQSGRIKQLARLNSERGGRHAALIESDAVRGQSSPEQRQTLRIFLRLDEKPLLVQQLDKFEEESRQLIRI